MGETLRERAVHEAALAVRTLTIPTNAASIIHASVDAVLAVAEAAPGLAEALRARAMSDTDSLCDLPDDEFDATLDSRLLVSHEIDGKALRIEGTPEALADVVRAWLR